MSEGLSRRELLQRGAAGGAALMITPTALGCRSQANDSVKPRIAIVGAGLAGLSCANRLADRGFASTVFEANPDRIGGRCWTAREFDGGQTAEHGGEFIDSRHRSIRRLADSLGLDLVDLFDIPNPGTSRWWLKGERRRAVRRRRSWRTFQRRLAATARRVGHYDHDRAGRAARELDELTAAEWLDVIMPGGAGSVPGRLVRAELASDFGLDARKLSALTLLGLYADPAGGADERYVIRGGNDQLVTGLAARLPDGTIRPGAPLEALFRRGDGSYGLQFGGVAGDVVADRVVLALPFSTLRRVDLDGSSLGRRRRACIRDLGMGTNAKVLMQFERRPQRYGRWNGYLTSDSPFLLTWESTLGQPGKGSVVTTFLGGRSGAAGLPADSPHGPTVEREVRRNLQSLGEGGETGIRGIRGGFAGTAWTDRWVSDPWARGSYAAFLPGQYTRYYGLTGRAAGGIHFAGEHTETGSQGYMEGAVRSGRRAAEEIASA